MFTYRVNPHWRELPHCSALVNGVGSHYVVENYVTTLSIKTVARGEAWYETPDGRYRVTPGVFLVLNAGQSYSMMIEEPTETLVPFFQPGLIERVVRGPIEFRERLYPMTKEIASPLARLHAREGSLEEQFFDLTAGLLALRDEVRREEWSLPAARRTTREELCRRLNRGRDFLLSSYDQPVTVAEAARVAAMSPFHFHRTFKAAFGCSPMQLLQSHRIDVAKRLLATGSDVTSACLGAGFESLGTFSALFRRRVGCSPRDYRKKQD